MPSSNGECNQDQNSAFEESDQILQTRNLIKFCKIITPQNLKPHIIGTDSGFGICGVLQYSSLLIQILQTRNLIKFCTREQTCYYMVQYEALHSEEPQ